MITDGTLLRQSPSHEFASDGVSHHIGSWKSQELGKLLGAIDHWKIHDLGIAQNETGVARLGRRSFD